MTSPLAPLPALVTWGESRVGLCATRALGRSNIPTSVISDRPWAPAWRSRYCRNAVHGPDADNGDEYVQFLEGYLRANPASALILCDDRSALQVGRNRERFIGLVPFMLPSQELLECVTDKYLMLRFSLDNDLPTPKTIFIADEKDLTATIDQLRWPIALKGSGGYASNRILKLNKPEELSAAYEFLKAAQAEDGYASPLHAQEWVEGTTYSVIVLCQHGKLVARCVIQKGLTFPSWGGVCVTAKTVLSPVIERAVDKILAHICWHGILEIELILDHRSGEASIIELSPDPNWALDLAIAAGVNFPLILWKLLQGASPDECQTSGIPGKRFVWLLPEGIQLLVEKPGNFFKLAKSFLSGKLSTDIDLNDSGPVLAWLRRTARLLKSKP